MPSLIIRMTKTHQYNERTHTWSLQATNCATACNTLSWVNSCDAVDLSSILSIFVCFFSFDFSSSICFKRSWGIAWWLSHFLCNTLYIHCSDSGYVLDFHILRGKSKKSKKLLGISTCDSVKKALLFLPFKFFTSLSFCKSFCLNNLELFTYLHSMHHHPFRVMVLSLVLNLTATWSEKIVTKLCVVSFFTIIISGMFEWWTSSRSLTS